MPINVMLADDHTVIMEGIKLVLEAKAKDIKVLCTVNNGKEALECSKYCNIDIFVLDIVMPGLDGTEVARQILANNPSKKILFLSMLEQIEGIREAVAIGVKGYLLKSDPFEKIIEAIRVINKGKTYMSPQIANCFFKETLNKIEPKEKSELTIREYEIAKEIINGMSDKEIASKMNIAFRTVRNHHANIMKKLKVHNKAGLIKNFFIENKEFE